MPQVPEPAMIRKTDEEMADELANDPAGQVVPFKQNPNALAKYKIIQGDKEVGFVYVQGLSEFDCTETWQLYKASAAGGDRAAYRYPSSDDRDVSLRLVFEAAVPDVREPEGLEPSDYDQLLAPVRRL